MQLGNLAGRTGISSDIEARQMPSCHTLISTHQMPCAVTKLVLLDRSFRQTISADGGIRADFLPSQYLQLYSAGLSRLIRYTSRLLDVRPPPWLLSCHHNYMSCGLASSHVDRTTLLLVALQRFETEPSARLS